jgi:predicted ester cyclase
VLWKQRKLDVADRLVAPDCVTHQLRSGSERTFARGPEAIRAHFGDWVAAFPDLHFEIEQIVTEGALVMTQCRMSGTHERDWLDVPATGRRIEIRMSVVQRIEGGRIVEDWVLVEALGLFQQLGLVAPTEALLATARSNGPDAAQTSKLPN